MSVVQYVWSNILQLIRLRALGIGPTDTSGNIYLNRKFYAYLITPQINSDYISLEFHGDGITSWRILPINFDCQIKIYFITL